MGDPVRTCIVLTAMLETEKQVTDLPTLIHDLIRPD